MEYIIFDMEWNQPLFNAARKEIAGVQLTGEIIQIGAVKLNSEFVACGNFFIDIEPVFYKKMNKRVGKITGITEKQLRGCKHFGAAFADFMDFCGQDFCLMTWGRDDMPMLFDNMKAHGIDASVLPEHYDLQLIFGYQVSRDLKQWSLAGAMERMGIEQRHPAHNALFDAVNTAKVAVQMDVSAGIADYDEMIKLTELGNNREIVEGFKSLGAALGDKSLRRIECPLCAVELEGGKWIGKHGKRMNFAKCPRHGILKFTLTAFNTDRESFSTARRVVPATEDMLENYIEKLREQESLQADLQRV